MTDFEYMNLAESALAAIERQCDVLNDATDADIDNQRTGGMITLVFKNKSQIVINLQKPLHEIWLAAKAGGFHYKFERQPASGHAGVWIDTKRRSEFFADLSDLASAQAGQILKFSAETLRV